MWEEFESTEETVRFLDELRYSLIDFDLDFKSPLFKSEPEVRNYLWRIITKLSYEIYEVQKHLT